MHNMTRVYRNTITILAVVSIIILHTLQLHTVVWKLCGW